SQPSSAPAPPQPSRRFRAISVPLLPESSPSPASSAQVIRQSPAAIIPALARARCSEFAPLAQKLAGPARAARFAVAPPAAPHSRVGRLRSAPARVSAQVSDPVAPRAARPLFAPRPAAMVQSAPPARRSPDQLFVRSPHIARKADRPDAGESPPA